MSPSLRLEDAIDGRVRQVVPGALRHVLAAADRVALHRVVVHARPCSRAAQCRRAGPRPRSRGRAARRTRRRRRGCLRTCRRWACGTAAVARPARRSASIAPLRRLGDEAEAGTFRVRTRVAVGGHRAIDQPRIERRQRREAQPQLVERARPVVLDEDVGACRSAGWSRSRPRRSFTFTHSPRLPMFCCSEVAALVGPVMAACTRPASPALGRSTLITSAPSPARQRLR